MINVIELGRDSNMEMKIEVQILDENQQQISCVCCGVALTTKNIGEPVFGITCNQCLADTNHKFRRYKEFINDERPGS